MHSRGRWAPSACSLFFLKNDPPSRDDLSRLEEYIEQKLAVAAQKLGSVHFDRAIGTAASASAVVCAANRIPRADRELADKKKVSVAQLRRLYRILSKLDVASRRRIEGLGYRRAEIIMPGIAVLLRTLETFGLSGLSYSDAGVRDGVIGDLAERGVGRERARLSRENRALVEQFARRFGVELRHARKVAHFARELFETLRPVHGLGLETGRLLEAAAYLRDVGHMISDSSHHKHSQYIVQNSDLADSRPPSADWWRCCAGITANRCRRRGIPIFMGSGRNSGGRCCIWRRCSGWPTPWTAAAISE